MLAPTLCSLTQAFKGGSVVETVIGLGTSLSVQLGNAGRTPDAQLSARGAVALHGVGVPCVRVPAFYGHLAGSYHG